MKASALWVICVCVTVLGTPLQAETPLAEGKSPGTFHYVFEDQIRFTGEPAFPSSVSITSNSRSKTIAEIKVTDEKPFVIAADLKPGTYQIWSEPQDKTRYGRVEIGKVHIGPTGLPYSRHPMIKPIQHVQKISGISPTGTPPIVVEEIRPTLKWNAVDGAEKYWVQYHYLIWPAVKQVKVRREVTVEPEFVFEADVPGGMLCIWGVSAIGKDGELARGVGHFLTRGTDARLGQAATTMPALAAPQPGDGYIGMGVGVIADRLPYAIVDEILPDSPASRTDLRPGDEIVRVDGRSLPSGETADFLRLIRSLRPGTTVKFDVRHVESGAPNDIQVIEIVVGVRP